MRRIGLVGGAAVALVLAGCSASGTGTTDHAAGSHRSTAPTAASGASRTDGAADPTPAPRAVAGAASTPTSPAPTGPCTTAKAARVVIVQVRAQHLWMCDGHRTVRDTPVTTGAVALPYDSTPVGTFHVQARDRDQTLNLLSGAQYTVKYWIPFDAPLFGFHDSPWQRMAYGSPRYRTRGSHGCVHMPLAAIRFLYGWAQVGTTVSIRR